MVFAQRCKGNLLHTIMYCNLVYLVYWLSSATTSLPAVVNRPSSHLRLSPASMLRMLKLFSSHAYGGFAGCICQFFAFCLQWNLCFDNFWLLQVDFRFSIWQGHKFLVVSGHLYQANIRREGYGSCHIDCSQYLVHYPGIPITHTLIKECHFWYFATPCDDRLGNYWDAQSRQLEFMRSHPRAPWTLEDQCAGWVATGGCPVEGADI